MILRVARYTTDLQVILAFYKAAGTPEVAAKNPYWKNNGITFSDPDGCRIVISISRSNT